MSCEEGVIVKASIPWLHKYIDTMHACLHYLKTQTQETHHRRLASTQFGGAEQQREIWSACWQALGLLTSCLHEPIRMSVKYSMRWWAECGVQWRVKSVEKRRRGGGGGGWEDWEEERKGEKRWEWVSEWVSEGRRRQGGCWGVCQVAINGGYGAWDEPDQTWHCNLLATVDVPNSATALILFGHLQLSGVGLGVTPRMDTKNHMWT
jgi:hypothetical protein